MVRWFILNKLTINMKKTHLVLIKDRKNRNGILKLILKLLGKELETQQNTKFLGIYVY